MKKNRPLCKCHDEPMVRSSKKKRTAWICRIKNIENCKRRRDTAKAKGLCVQCQSRPALDGILRCKPCKISDRDTTRKRNRRKTARSLSGKIGWLEHKYPFLKEVTSGS